LAAGVELETIGGASLGGYGEYVEAGRLIGDVEVRKEELDVVDTAGGDGAIVEMHCYAVGRSEICCEDEALEIGDVVWGLST